MFYFLAELARRRKNITQSPRLRGRHVQNARTKKRERLRNYRFKIAASATADPKIEVSAVSIAT